MASGNSTVKIYIAGDAGGISRASRDAEHALARLSGRAQTHFGRMTDFAGGFGLAMGAGGLVGELQDSVKAFQESEKSAARMSAQLDTLGQNTGRVRDEIASAIEKQSEFGAFDDEDLQDSFTRILRSTKDVGEALELNNLVMDIARGRNVDLATAAEAVAKAAAGNTQALRRMGIQIEKGATAQEAIAAAQAAYAGQAQRYGESSASSADRAAIAWENAQEQIGEQAAQAFVAGAEGAQRLAGSVDDLVGAVGGLGPLVAAGGAFAGLRLIGPSALDAAAGIRGLSQQVVVFKRSGLDKNGPFGKVNWGMTVSRAAKTAGGALTSLAGGPMGVAAIGAGALALGIARVAEEMTSVEEEARDAAHAIQSLADTELAVQDATLQAKQAEIDYQAAQGQRQRVARQLNGLQRDYARYVRDGNAASPRAIELQQKTNAKQKEYAQALLNAQTAQLRLKASQREVLRTTAEHEAAAGNLQKQLRGLASTSDESTTGLTNAALAGGRAGTAMTAASADAADAARKFADGLVEIANSSTDMDAAQKQTARSVAELARQIGRVPSEKEIEIISNALAAGESIDDIKRKLGLLPPKTPANVNTNAGTAAGSVAELNREIARLPSSKTVTIYENIVRDGERHGAAATGAAIAGRFDGRDDIPLRVSRGEVVLNPQQIAMVGASRVYGALAATGAPVIRAGGGFATGGGPVGTMTQIRDTRFALGPRIERAARAYELRFNDLDAQLAAAELTDSPVDDNKVRQRMRALITKRIEQVRFFLTQHPKGRMRTELLGELASLRRSLPNYAELGASDGGGVSTADLEAQLAQANARVSGLQRNLALSEAAFGTFGGGGGGGVHYHSHSVFPPTPDQFRVAGGFMADAFGRQPFRRTPRIRIGA